MTQKPIHYPGPEELLREVRVQLTKDTLAKLSSTSIEDYVADFIRKVVPDIDLRYVEREMIYVLPGVSKPEDRPRDTGFMQVFYGKGPASHELAAILRQYIEFEKVEAFGAPLPAASNNLK